MAGAEGALRDPGSAAGTGSAGPLRWGRAPGAGGAGRPGAALPPPPRPPRASREPGAGAERPGAAPGPGPRNFAFRARPAACWGLAGELGCARSRGAAGARQGRLQTAGGAGASIPGERVNKCRVYRAPSGARTCGSRGLGVAAAGEPARGAARHCPAALRPALGEDPTPQMPGLGHHGGPGPRTFGLSPVVRW